MKLTSLKYAALVALVLQCVSSRALDFQYSFVNNDGFGTTPGVTVSGKILGLNDNVINFQQVTVTLDSITGPDNLGFAPHSWFNFGVFNVVAGTITLAQFSSFDATLGIDLNTAPGGRGLVFPEPGFLPFYRNQNPNEGAPEITFSLVREQAPDAGDTLALLGLGLVTVAGIRRFAGAV